MSLGAVVYGGTGGDPLNKLNTLDIVESMAHRADGVSEKLNRHFTATMNGERGWRKRAE